MWWLPSVAVSSFGVREVDILMFAVRSFDRHAVDLAAIRTA